MPPTLDLTGQRFGRLVVEGPAPPSRSGNRLQRRWFCRCDCGQVISAMRGALRSGHTRSCGCYFLEVCRERNLTHGESREGHSTAEYRAWAQMIARCENPRARHWPWYGGRGIKVCPRWRESYEAFLADMGRKPSPHHSIDRFPNNDGDYEPGNCRWATQREQIANQRRSRRGYSDRPQQ